MLQQYAKANGFDYNKMQRDFDRSSPVEQQYFLAQIGGEVEEPDNGEQEQLLQYVAQAIQQGNKPEAIINFLEQSGVPREEAIQIIQSVTQSMQAQEMQQGGFSRDNTYVEKPLSLFSNINKNQFLKPAFNFGAYDAYQTSTLRNINKKDSTDYKFHFNSNLKRTNKELDKDISALTQMVYSGEYNGEDKLYFYKQLKALQDLRAQSNNKQTGGMQEESMQQPMQEQPMQRSQQEQGISQEQEVQILQMFAKISGMDLQTLVQQYSKMNPQQKQEALMQMVKVIQEYEQGNQQPQGQVEEQEIQAQQMADGGYTQQIPELSQEEFDSLSEEEQQEYLSLVQGQDEMQAFDLTDMQTGGIPITSEGYRELDPIKNPKAFIPSGRLTMKGIKYPIKASNGYTGEPYGIMQPGGEYNFPTDLVLEEPILQQGGYTYAQTNADIDSEILNIFAELDKPHKFKKGRSEASIQAEQGQLDNANYLKDQILALKAIKDKNGLYKSSTDPSITGFFPTLKQSVVNALSPGKFTADTYDENNKLVERGTYYDRLNTLQSELRRVNKGLKLIQGTENPGKLFSLYDTKTTSSASPTRNFFNKTAAGLWDWTDSVGRKLIGDHRYNEAIMPELTEEDRQIISIKPKATKSKNIYKATKSKNIYKAADGKEYILEQVGGIPYAQTSVKKSADGLYHLPNGQVLDKNGRLVSSPEENKTIVSSYLDSDGDTVIKYSDGTSSLRINSEPTPSQIEYDRVRLNNQVSNPNSEIERERRFLIRNGYKIPATGGKDKYFLAARDAYLLKNKKTTLNNTTQTTSVQNAPAAENLNTSSFANSIPLSSWNAGKLNLDKIPDNVGVGINTTNYDFAGSDVKDKTLSEISSDYYTNRNKEDYGIGEKSKLFPSRFVANPVAEKEYKDIEMSIDNPLVNLANRYALQKAFAPIYLPYKPDNNLNVKLQPYVNFDTQRNLVSSQLQSIKPLINANSSTGMSLLSNMYGKTEEQLNTINNKDAQLRAEVDQQNMQLLTNQANTARLNSDKNNMTYQDLFQRTVAARDNNIGVGLINFAKIQAERQAARDAINKLAIDNAYVSILNKPFRGLSGKITARIDTQAHKDDLKTRVKENKTALTRADIIKIGLEEGNSLEKINKFLSGWGI